MYVDTKDNWRLRDPLFAEGFSEGLCKAGIKLPSEPDENDRPIAVLGGALGKVIGDGVSLFRHPVTGHATILILEREGSGPGNEHNALKWFEVAHADKKLRIEKKPPLVVSNKADEIVYDSMLILLSFSRSEGKSGGWSTSECLKSMEFTSLLGAHINRLSEIDELPFKIVVQGSSEMIKDWKCRGASQAKQLAEWMYQRSS